MSKLLNRLLGAALAIPFLAGTALAVPVSIIPEPATTLVVGEVVDGVYLESLDVNGNIQAEGFAFINDNGDLFRHSYATGVTSFVDSNIIRFRDGDGNIVVETATGIQVYDFGGDLVATPSGFIAGGSNHRGELVGQAGGVASALVTPGDSEPMLFQNPGESIFGGFLDIDNEGNAAGFNGAGELIALELGSLNGSVGASSLGVTELVISNGFVFADDGSLFATDGSLSSSFGSGIFGQGYVAGEGFYATSGNQALFFDLALDLVGEATLAGDIFDIRFDEAAGDYFALFEGSLRESSFVFTFGDSGGGTNIAAVPLPASALLLIPALLGLLGFRKRQTI